MGLTGGLCIDGASVADPVAAPVLEALLDATVALYDSTSGVDSPCAVMFLSGAAAALDHGRDCAAGCSGQLWVRLVQAYPTTRFPEQQVTAYRGELSYAVVVELGMVRPAPLETEIDGQLFVPTVEAEQAAAALAVTDQAILRHAALVSYGDELNVDLVLGAYTPFGPEGGVVGGSVTVTVLVP
jgi:hypothetical protein